MRKHRPREGELIPTRQSTFLSGGTLRDLTPGRLSAILRRLDAGDVTDAMLLFDEMEEKDLHLGAVTQTRVLSVVAKDREIVAASGSAEDEMIAEFVRQNFDSIPRRQELLASLMSAVTRGFAMAEIIWDVSEGMATVADVLPRPQSLFTFVDQGDPSPPLDFPRYIDPRNPADLDLPRDKFIFHRNARGAGGCLRSGLYRGISWYYLFTNFTIKDWLTFIDIYGIPMRLGRYKPTADDRSREVLKKAVANLGSDAAAVISDDTTIEFIQSAASGDAGLFREASEFFNRQKSKRILGQTLTTEGERGGGGAYALGKVHDRVRGDITAYDCKSLDETISEDLIRPLVDFNFGPRKRYPRIVTRLADSGEADARLDQIKKLVELGVKIPARVLADITGTPIMGDLDAPIGFSGEQKEK